MDQFSGHQKFKFLKIWCFIPQSVDNFMLIKIHKKNMAWKWTYLVISLKNVPTPQIVIFIGKRSFRNFVVYKEAVARRCSVKKVFLEILQSSQESNCARVCNFIKKEALTEVFSCKFCKISKSTLPYRTRPVADSDDIIVFCCKIFESTVTPLIFFIKLFENNFNPLVSSPKDRIPNT